MNEELKKLSKEQLIELAEIYSKDWLACDGLWFQAVEKRQGMDGAMDCDKEIWRSFTVIEAKRIKEFLKLPERAGLEGLEKAMRFRLYANLNDEEYIQLRGETDSSEASSSETSSKMIYRTLNCRVQRARSRKGMEWHPCKAIGEIEYADFAKVIDDRISCKCISCYPDITESEREGCCAWEFTLEETASKEEITYRQVQPSDNPTLKFLVQNGLKSNGLAIPGTAYFDPNLDDLCGYYMAMPEKRNYFVAVNPEGRVVGGCGVDVFEGLEDCAELQKLYVAEDCHGHGIATRLVKMVEEEAKRLGYGKIYIETHSNLQAALKLYEKEGYTLIDRPPYAVHETMDCFLIKEL
ncbi:MAG: GNAT family N-acetyltransferase [Firmicutes bacterium]|nr:GNAT family N-acetyltransferase [Bacillota bacterium]